MECICQHDDVEQVFYSLEFNERPWTTNSERAGNRWERAALVKTWRQAFKLLAKSEKIPPLVWAHVTVEPFQKGGVLQDVASCNPAVKAAIDGVVDAEVLIDDSPKYLKSITFLPPKKGKNSLVIHIRGVKREGKE